jgi:hypothetical protein
MPLLLARRIKPGIFLTLFLRHVLQTRPTKNV